MWALIMFTNLKQKILQTWWPLVFTFVLNVIGLIMFVFGLLDKKYIFET